MGIIGSGAFCKLISLKLCIRKGLIVTLLLVSMFVGYFLCYCSC